MNACLHIDLFEHIGCEDGSVHVFSFTTGTEVHQLKGHKGKVRSRPFSGIIVMEEKGFKQYVASLKKMSTVVSILTEILKKCYKSL